MFRNPLKKKFGKQRENGLKISFSVFVRYHVSRVFQMFHKILTSNEMNRYWQHQREQEIGMEERYKPKLMYYLYFNINYNNKNKSFTFIVLYLFHILK